MTKPSSFLATLTSPSQTFVGSVIEPSRQSDESLLGRRMVDDVTLVIEETLDPEGWLIITGWDSTPAERRLLG